MQEWGSQVLFEIDTNTSTSAGDKSGGSETVDVTLPLHLRYLTPASGGYSQVDMPYPTVFWACNSDGSIGNEDADFKPSGNPFDRRELGYDSFFGEKTMFHHVNPLISTATNASTSNSNSNGNNVNSSSTAAERDTGLILRINVPVLDLKQAWYIEPVTAAVVGLGVLWILWKCFGPIGDEAVVTKGEGKNVRRVGKEDGASDTARVSETSEAKKLR